MASTLRGLGFGCWGSMWNVVKVWSCGLVLNVIADICGWLCFCSIAAGMLTLDAELVLLYTFVAATAVFVTTIARQ